MEEEAVYKTLEGNSHMKSYFGDKRIRLRIKLKEIDCVNVNCIELEEYRK
jgi:hypothetical protein